MKKSYTALLVTLFVLGLAAFTNPSKDEYIAWMKEEALRKSDGLLEKGLISLLGNTIVESSTTTNNFVFFSTFTTNINRDFRLKAIGIFRNFFPIQTVTPTVSIKHDESTSKTADNQPIKNSLTEAVEPPKKSIDPTVQSARTVKVIGDSGTYVLPVYGVTMTYGISMENPLFAIPKKPLPDIHFNIPSELASDLAVFWITTGYKDLSNKDVQGMMFLAPKDWKPIQAAEGANGSIAFTLVSDPSSKNPETISYENTGGCFGCAVDNIGRYFPKAREWAEKNTVVPGTKLESPIDMKNVVYLDDHTVAYFLQEHSNPYETNGVAIEYHDTSPIYFSNYRITSQKKQLATTVLNFFLKYYKTQ